MSFGPLAPFTVPRAALWPFGRLILLALLAGVIVGLLIASFAFSAPPSSGASSRVPDRTVGTVSDDSGSLDRGAVRASGVEVPRSRPRPTEDPSPASEPVLLEASPRVERDDPAAILALIHDAAAHYHIDAASFERCARQESFNLRQDVIDGITRGDGGDAVGLFQFHRQTFIVNAKRLLGVDVGDRRTDPALSAAVAAWMWSIGQRGQWGCAG